MNEFGIDLKDMRRLEKFFKKAPQQLPRSTANILNGLAFEAKKIDAQILAERLTMRNRRFVESSIRVQKARTGRIESQIALVGSVKRPRFTGWEEQEKGSVPKKRYTASIKARGNTQGKVKTKARFRQGTKFYKPEQFQGRDLRSRFQFMMRVLNTRGGAQAFLLKDNYKTRHGIMGRGLYLLQGHKISRLRERQAVPTKRLSWNERMIHTLQHRKVLTKLWVKELQRLTAQGMRT